MAKQIKKTAKKAGSKIIKQGLTKKAATKKVTSGGKIIKQGLAKKSATKKPAAGSKIIKQGAPKKPVAKKAAGNKIIKQEITKKAAAKTNKIIKQGAPKKATTKKSALKKSPTTPPSTAAVPTGSGGTRGFSLRAAGIAIIDVTFRDVGAGLSNITATCNGEEKSLNASGSITFSGVKKDDIIGIDGSSAGSTEIRISLPATPQQMNFSPGNFNDNFIIE